MVSSNPSPIRFLRLFSWVTCVNTRRTSSRCVFSGSFRQIAATITAINPQTGELTVKDLASKKPLTIKIDADSAMRKLPEQAARMMARRYAPGAQAPEGAGGGRGGRGGDVGQMLDNLPAMPISELK